MSSGKRASVWMRLTAELLRRRWALCAFHPIALAVAACGLPDDRTPRIIAADEAPLDLSEVPGNADAR